MEIDFNSKTRIDFDIPSVKLAPGGGKVQSVNGKTGNVVLNASDVGAATLEDITEATKGLATQTEVTEIKDSLKQKVSYSDLDGTSIYKGQDGKIHASGEGGNSKQVEKNTRDIDHLYKLAQGQILDFENQVESGMNDKPEGAEYFSMIEAYGNTEQTTYNGYNLVSDIFQGKSYLNTTGEIASYSERVAINIIQKNGDMIVTCVNTHDYDIFIQGRFVKNNVCVGTSSAYGFNPNIKQSRTFTLPSDIDFDDIRLYFYATGGKYVYAENIGELQIEYGSTAHDYEPYVGGIPSPNPNYPQDVVGVEELNFEVVGKNLLPPIDNASPSSYSGVSCVLNGDGTYTLNGTLQNTGTDKNINIWLAGSYKNFTQLDISRPIAGPFKAGIYTASGGNIMLVARDKTKSISIQSGSTKTVDFDFYIVTVRVGNANSPTQTFDNQVFYTEIVPEVVDDVIIQIAENKKAFSDEGLYFDSETNSFLFPLDSEFSESINGYADVQVKIVVGADVKLSPVKQILVSPSIIKEEV